MKATGRFLRAFLLTNWGLKLTAILLAFALWLMVRGSQGERVFTVPLTVQIPRNMEIVNERPGFVEITAQGTLSSLTGYQPNLTYNIDLQSASEGTQTIPLTPAGVRVSPATGLKVTRVNPTKIVLTLERVVAKDVPVKTPVLGTPAPGIDLYQVTTRPSVVRISGPRSLINVVRELETDSVSLAAQSHSFSAMLNFNLPDDDIRTSPSGPVEATIELGPHRDRRTLRVPVALPEESDVTARPDFVYLSLLVPVTFKGSLTEKDFRVTVSVPDSGLLEGQVTVSPKVEQTGVLDNGITIREVSPEKITLLRKARKK